MPARFRIDQPYQQIDHGTECNWTNIFKSGHIFQYKSFFFFFFFFLIYDFGCENKSIQVDIPKVAWATLVTDWRKAKV